MSVREYIREQPDIIRAAIAAAAQARVPGAVDHGAVLVGSGSSFNALTAAAATVSAPRRSTLRVVGPQTYLRDIGEGRAAPVPVVVLSQSGASTTSIEAARAAAAHGSATLVVTCEPESPIARLSLPTCILPIGGEPIGPKTKGFTATLAGALSLLARGDDRTLPDFPAAEFARLIDEAEQVSSKLSGELRGLDYLVVSETGASSE